MHFYIYLQLSYKHRVVKQIINIFYIFSSIANTFSKTARYVHIND